MEEGIKTLGLTVLYMGYEVKTENGQEPDSQLPEIPAKCNPARPLFLDRSGC